jgi:DNA helicase II / ATP-dependent DNA helicase PcrA
MGYNETGLLAIGGYQGAAMDTGMRLMAEEAVRLLLQRFRQNYEFINEDRTPLDELVNWLDLRIETFHPDDEPPGTYGYVDPDESENLIWLCRDLPETLRRFTLAHELGHVVLHCHSNERIQHLSGDLASLLKLQEEQLLTPTLSHQDPCHDSDVQENMTLDQEQLQDALGIGQQYDPRSQREIAANIFAAELLMPSERVHARYLEPQTSPMSLASIFAVSHAAMLNRLVGMLKVPTPQVGIRSDRVPDASDGDAESINHGRGRTESLLQPTEFSPNEQKSIPTANQGRKQYDEFQQAAIEAPTPALIVAGPGSGKTSTLIGRVEHIIHTLGVPPQRILALTFSRKAAQEMKERLQSLLGGDIQAFYPLPEVSTFHAFCANLLRQYSTAVGLREDFTLIDEAEGYFLLRQMSNDMHLRHYQKLQSPTYYFPDILKAISRAKDELISPEEYAHLAQKMLEQAHNEEAQQKAEKALEIAHLYALYQQALARRGDSDFGGLLALTVQLFREHPEILHEQQQKYLHILVDEFQDVNRASGVLLRELAGDDQHVWVVGDSNQAIYGFRGASPANISQFTTDFPGAVVLPLSRNYRSRPDLVSIAEAFRCVQLELGQEPGKNEPVRLTHTDAYVTLAKASDEASELAGLVKDIQYKHNNGFAYKDMIVLCRTRAQVQKISRALAKADLPVIERGGMLEQEHIKDVLSILLLLTNSSGMGILRVTRYFEHPLSQSDIEALLMAAREQKTTPTMLIYNGDAPASISIKGRHTLLQLANTLQSLQHVPEIWSLLAQYLFMETDLVRNLLSNRESKQNSTILTDYDALLQLARHYDQQALRRELHSQETTEGSDEPAPQRAPLQERIKGFLEYVSLLVLLRQDGNNRQSSDESNGSASDIIRIMTVHASKGLEFPVVYMPGLVQRRFPSQARSSPVEAPAGMLPEESTGNAAHESGESCLFYVGVTRARDQLVLSHSERYGKIKYKRSPYIDALEAGLATGRITKLHWESASSDETTETAQQPVASSQPSENFINAMRPQTLSASAIEAYQRCPRQYAYSMLYHFENEADTYQLFWQATQKTVEALRQKIQENKGSGEQTNPLPTQQETQELYTQHWQELGGHDAPFAPLYEEHGHEIVEAIRRTLSVQEDVTWDMRPKYNVDIGGKTVHVTVDRIEASTQSGEKPPRFVRTRFGKRKDKPVATTRELFYTLAYRQAHPGQNVELHSHNMSTGEVDPITLSAKKEQSLREEVEQSIKGLEQHTYPAQPAEPFRCPTCPFFLICPA